MKCFKVIGYSLNNFVDINEHKVALMDLCNNALNGCVKMFKAL